MKTKSRTFAILLWAALLATTVPALLFAGDVPATFLYKLSNFNGVIPFASPKLFADRVNHEVFVVEGASISIFNSSGMEVYRSEYDAESGTLLDIAVDSKGDLYTLTQKGSSSQINVCNYRLEPQRALELHGLPPQFSGFAFTSLRYHDNHLYLQNDAQMKVVIVDMEGNFVKGVDVFELLEPSLQDDTKKVGKGGKSAAKKKSREQLRAENGMDGFSVGSQGELLFALPITGLAGIVTPDGKGSVFGKRGSGPGKLSVPCAVVDDGCGHYLVLDKLRTVILVYNKQFEFITEFGSLGVRDAYLVAPSAMAMGDGGRLYVGQTMSRGVNVYRMVTDSSS